jgi:hypothetical protein
MNPRVKNVTANADFTLSIIFTNGEKGIFDVKQFFHLPVFRPIQNMSVFKKVTVGNGQTVCWGTDIDICPDTVYIEAKKY